MEQFQVLLFYLLGSQISSLNKQPECCNLTYEEMTVGQLAAGLQAAAEDTGGIYGIALWCHSSTLTLELHASITGFIIYERDQLSRMWHIIFLFIYFLTMQLLLKGHLNVRTCCTGCLSVFCSSI